MTIYLIKHGTTPTGFGIRQRSNGALRATSPCCGRSMVSKAYGIAECKGCSSAVTQPNPLVEEQGRPTIDSDISTNITLKGTYGIEWWVRTVTGIPDLEVEIS